MKEKLLSGLLFLLICFAGFEYAKMYYKEKREKERIAESFRASDEMLNYYRTRNGKLAARNQALQLRYSEMQQIYPKVLNEIRNLNVRPKHVTQYTETVVKQEKEILTKLRDSLICDTIHAKIFSYNDNFYTVKGIAIGDSQKVKITSLDSLIQVVYKGKRAHPWLWILSRRNLEQVITSRNPGSTILYNRTIQIVKR